MSRTYRPGDRLRDRDYPNEEVELLRRVHDDPETWETQRYVDGLVCASWEVESDSLDEFYEPLEPAGTITLELTRDKAAALQDVLEWADGFWCDGSIVEDTITELREALDA